MSYSRARSTDMARTLFLSCDFSSWQVTTSPVGSWVMRTAEARADLHDDVAGVVRVARPQEVRELRHEVGAPAAEGVGLILRQLAQLRVGAVGQQLARLRELRLDGLQLLVGRDGLL